MLNRNSGSQVEGGSPGGSTNVSQGSESCAETRRDGWSRRREGKAQEAASPRTKDGVPGRVRTCNLPLRRGMLYPIELLRRASGVHGPPYGTASMLPSEPGFVMSSLRFLPVGGFQPQARTPASCKTISKRRTASSRLVELSTRRTRSSTCVIDCWLRAIRCSISCCPSLPR